MSNTRLENQLRWITILHQACGFGLFPRDGATRALATREEATRALVAAADIVIEFFSLDMIGHDGGGEWEDRLNLAQFISICFATLKHLCGTNVCMWRLLALSEAELLQYPELDRIVLVCQDVLGIAHSLCFRLRRKGVEAIGPLAVLVQQLRKTIEIKGAASPTSPVPERDIPMDVDESVSQCSTPAGPTRLEAPAKLTIKVKRAAASNLSVPEADTPMDVDESVSECSTLASPARIEAPPKPTVEDSAMVTHDLSPLPPPEDILLDTPPVDPPIVSVKSIKPMTVKGKGRRRPPGMRPHESAPVQVAEDIPPAAVPTPEPDSIPGIYDSWIEDALDILLPPLQISIPPGLVWPMDQPTAF